MCFSNFKLTIFVRQSNEEKTRAMKNVKLSTIEKQIRDGKVECMTDLRIGYVEIRNCITDKRYFVNVVK